MIRIGPHTPPPDVARDAWYRAPEARKILGVSAKFFNDTRRDDMIRNGERRKEGGKVYIKGSAILRLWLEWQLTHKPLKQIKNYGNQRKNRRSIPS